MDWGYQFTRGELEQDEDVRVVQCENVAAELKDTDFVVPLMTPLTADLLNEAPNLMLILQYGAGVEGVDIEAATKLGIWVSNIPSAGTGNSVSCAEMAIFLILATLRNINAMQQSIETRQLGVPLGSMLQGKRVLVIGFGNIAKELIIRLAPFRVTISALRRSSTWGHHHDSLSEQAEEQLIDKGTWPQDTSRLASEADIIAVTCKQDASNLGMINREFLNACKDGVRIVNVARGGLLDYDAILEGLNSGKIGGMGLDVQFWEPFDPEDPIAQHERVYLTPHVAGVTEHSYRQMAKVVAEETRRIKKGLPPTVQLNTEESMRARGSCPRVGGSS